MNEKNRNLSLRVVSALLLFPVLVWITWLGGMPFALLLSGAAAVSAFELIGMFAAVGVPELFGVLVAGLLPLAPWWAAQGASYAYSPLVPIAVAVSAMVLLVLNLFRPGPLEGAPQRVQTLS